MTPEETLAAIETITIRANALYREESLRDQFAMSAISECLRYFAHPDIITTCGGTLEEMAAVDAYRVADAMMKAREREEEDKPECHHEWVCADGPLDKCRLCGEFEMDYKHAATKGAL
jgi:hypothetical protein